MDIGTVDQADQEAQMKIEDPPNSDTTCSPASSNRGKDQSCATTEENERKTVQLAALKDLLQSAKTAATGKDSLKEFCSQSCLASFNDKNNDATQKPSQSVGPQSLCSVCSRCCISKHDVIMNGTVHKMCSDACFKNFRTAKNLSMACCANCGNYCHNKPMLLQMDGSGQVLCNAECLAKYKQEKVRNSQKQESFCTMLPIESSQRQTAVPIRPRRDSSKQPQKLNCSQCSCHITSKPEVIQNKGKLVFVCSAKCSEEFKKANSVTSLCESCKMEKITAEAEKINNKDCFFCSDECKVLFRQKLAESWGKHCRSCGYCCSMSEKLVTAMYGGSAEEFCSEDCRSKYTLLFCHVSKLHCS
ncbi:unnamed protein product [Tetraodon nigroviridis]|uniref:(spotted green pufferfish) hypothetical protein n=1 Tax=Tetraodon nigroviridis TaxID=99883 RepID=Q4SAL6_TETNG|nr:unnamed protein product [Tetraodon nigroviridis]